MGSPMPERFLHVAYVLQYEAAAKMKVDKERFEALMARLIGTPHQRQEKG